MTFAHRILPHPLLSLILIAVWLLLNNTVALGHVVLGTVFALVLPWFTAAFWPEELRLHRPVLALRFVLMVLWDITVANIDVARLILNPRRTLQPAFVTLPLDLDNDFAITVLAATISLTPGTVSIDVDETRSSLLVHCLHVEGEASLVAQLKSRYETAIKEIFGC